jgi:AcrR family transcriptional regulator
MPNPRRNLGAAPTKAGKPRKAGKYERRYAEIIDAAAAVFAEKGYHGSSTKDIADRLGIRQGSLYYYFESKESALEEVCQKGVEGFVQGLEAILARDIPPEEMLRAAVLSHLEPLEERPNYVRVFLRERHDLPPERHRKIAAASRHYEQLLETLFRRGVEAGAFRADLDCRLATLGLLGMCNTVSDWHGTETNASIKVIAENFALLLIEGAVRERR